MTARDPAQTIEDRMLLTSRSIPLVDLITVERASLTLCRIRDLFQRSTGLDFFLFFQTQPMGKWKE
ncbi:MAG: hypothetical protein ABIH23_01425, partial [bacterium]